jgi:hypothetical protein
VNDVKKQPNSIEPMDKVNFDHHLHRWKYNKLVWLVCAHSDYCAPVVGTVVTGEVERICLKNGLLFHELLRYIQDRDKY